MQDNQKPSGAQAAGGAARRWLAPAVFLALAALSAARLGGAWNAGRMHANDFKHLWAGAVILAQGGDPYDAETMFMAARTHGLGGINPYVYLPATGLMMRPLAGMGFAEAARTWFLMNWLLAWGAVLAASRVLRARPKAPVMIAGGAWLLLALPFYRQMSAGQMNVVLMAALIAVPGLMMRGRVRAAGIVLGAAAAFKISPLFLIPFVADGGRGWRSLRAPAWACATFAAFGLAAELWAGAGVTRAALPTLAAMRYGRSTWAEFGNDFHRDPFNQSINSFLHHIMTVNPHTTPWFDLGERTANLLTMAASLALLMSGLLMLARRHPSWCSRPVRRCGRASGAAWTRSDTRCFYAGSLLMLLLPSLMWDHYAVQALPAALFVIGRAPLSRRLWLRQPGVARRAMTAPLLAAAALVILAWPVAHAAPWNHSGWRLLVISIRLWGTLLLLFTLACPLIGKPRAQG